MKNTENLKGFTSDLDRLKSTFKKGKQDIDHLRSIELVINICTVLGIASLWLSPNILTIMALAIGSFGRWTILGHHILHKAYDESKSPQNFGPNAPEYVHSGPCFAFLADGFTFFDTGPSLSEEAQDTAKQATVKSAILRKNMMSPFLFIILGKP